MGAGCMKHFYSPVLAITGPTAVGKTALADTLALRFRGEIINCDVGQFYTPLTIGTAKPDVGAAMIPHHLFSIIDTPRNITVVEYRDLVLQKIAQVKERGNLPILVGGSAFYIQSLIFPPVLQSLPVTDKLARRETTEQLWQELFLIDPERARALHHHDRYRIERALTIWDAVGVKPSLYTPTYCPPVDMELVIVGKERAALYNTINERVLVMMQQGWLEEVRALDEGWQQFLLEKKIIGYDDIIAYLKKSDCSEAAYAALVERIQQKTRAYAKKQLCFFKQLSTKIIKAQQTDVGSYRVEVSYADLTAYPLELYIKQLSEKLKTSLT